jgi:hypothetical protein
VHRSQGATTARAHLFADGGGRELAYVAMSRAREATHAWVVADDLAQAADDLRRDWSVRRTPTWALDAGLPAVPIKEAVVSLAMPDHARAVALALARTRTSAGSIGHLRAPDFSSELAEARAAVQEAEQARAEAGLAAARGEAEHGSHWWARRTAAKGTNAWAERQADARQRWQDHVAPEVARLDAVIVLRRDELERLNASHERQAARSATVVEGRRVTQGIVAGLVARVEQYRDRLDGAGRPPLGHAAPPVGPSVGAAIAYRAPAPGRDHGADL